ncbi:MAG: hypothetical protein AAF724_01810 [Pseudomonadota bacterium]
MLRSLALLVVLLSALWTQSAPAQETTQTFNAPTINGIRLDWCRLYGRQCGAPAAELFCRSRGFTRAVDFSIDPRIGVFGVPTVVFGDGRLCRSRACSGFQQITCARAAPVEVQRDSRPADWRRSVGTGPDMKTVVVNANTTRFRNPHIDNLRVDWCRNWGANCGKPAADLFCREMGFESANRFLMDRTSGINGIPSLVIGDDRVCNARYCNAFKVIACTNQSAPGTLAADAAEPTEREHGSADDGQLAFIAPLPTRKPPLPQSTPEPGPEAETPSDADIKPAVSYAQFKAQAPTVIAVNWVNLLDSTGQYPAGASLFACADGDCSAANTADLTLSPQATDQSVKMNFNVDNVPHASGVIWQASYLPFPPFDSGSQADLSPQGLLDYDIVEVKQGWFALDMKELASDLPGGGDPAIVHLRVLPVSEAGLEQVVGLPSNTMRLFYGAEVPTPPPYEGYARENVADSRPQLRMKALEFIPFQRRASLPESCTADQQTGGDTTGDSSLEADAIRPGSWDWANKRYQWIKDRFMSIGGPMTQNLVSDETWEFALNTALVSAGIPPDTPNIEQVMREGVDGLSGTVAQAVVLQFATDALAANAGALSSGLSAEDAASMDEDALLDRLRREIEDRARQAILQTTEDLDAQLTAAAESDEACTPTSVQAVYKVTVENTGDERYSDLAVTVDATPVYAQQVWTIDLEPGETKTLTAVGEPRLDNGPYSEPQLSPSERAEEDFDRWWNEIVDQNEVEISVSLPGALACIGGDPTSQFCERERFVAHKSPPQLVSEPYTFWQ